MKGLESMLADYRLGKREFPTYTELAALAAAPVSLGEAKAVAKIHAYPNGSREISYKLKDIADLSNGTELFPAAPSTIKAEQAPDKHPSALSIAGIARRHFGNPIPPAAYGFASELIATTLLSIKAEPTGEQS